MSAGTLLNNSQPKDKYFNKFLRFYSVLFLIFIAFILGFMSGKQNSEQAVNNSDDGTVYNKKEKPDFLSKDVNFNLFWDIWDTIEQNYVKQPVSETDLLYGAMAGSVASLGDPYSVFFDPETTQEFNEGLQGVFEGIGAEIAIKNERLTIVTPLPGSPAETAGLQPGDKVYAINGDDTTGISIDYAISKIRGPKGTEVILTIGRDGLGDLQEIKIVRDTIHIDSIKWEIIDNNIALITLSEFNEDTPDKFNQAVLDIAAKNPKGIILDMRHNPGGFLDGAIKIASEWVDDDVIVYEKRSDGDLQAHKDKFGRARLRDFKTVVLVNEGSASASEIVAGALKDHGLATIVGKKTFGKGSVQGLYDLADGSSIKLTVAMWLTPNENTIDGEGIEPDVDVEFTKENFDNDEDPQLDKAIEIINQ